MGGQAWIQRGRGSLPSHSQIRTVTDCALIRAGGEKRQIDKGKTLLGMRAWKIQKREHLMVVQAVTKNVILYVGRKP